MQNDFKEWYSQGAELDNLEVISAFEKEHGIILPQEYIKLVRFRDGGLLKKDLFFYQDSREMRNCVADFLCWQKETLGENECVPYEVNNPPEFFPKRLIPFAPDGGGNYVCFDYRDCKENPPIVFWHHEIEENEGIFPLANSFDEFTNNLKSEDELDKP
jgi:hypothetical protein